MKPAPFLLAIVLAARLGAADAAPKAAAPAAAAKAAPAAAPTETASLASLPPSPLVTRMKQIRASLDDVFKIREAGALPDLRLNPFHLPGTPATATQSQAVATVGGRAVAPETEPARLRRLVGGLAWGRITDRNGQELVTIAGANYREGESFGLTDPLTNSRAVIRVLRISGNNLTLRLGASELTLTK
jgi:hypothetical protein